MTALATIARYARQIDGLGAEFSAEIERCFDHIFAYPARYRFTDKIFRVITPERFPYSIFYLWILDQSHVFIATLFQQKRHPGSWMNRRFS